MRRALALLVLVALLTTGCASTLRALEKFRQRTQDMAEDPIRRTHFATEVSLSSTAMSIAIGCAMLLAPTLVGMAVCPLVGVAAYFIGYEFILEPISKDRVKAGEPSLVGPYWERGPQDGEKFIRE